MGDNKTQFIAQQEPYEVHLHAGILPNSLTYKFTVLDFPANLDMDLLEIKKNVKLKEDTPQAQDQIAAAKVQGKNIDTAIKFVYREFGVTIPGPRPVTKQNQVFWNGTPVQVIIEVIGGGGASTVTDVAL